MGYQSKTYSLSDEVIARIEGWTERYGSPNKVLMALLPPCNGPIPSMERALDAAGVEKDSRTGKALETWRSGRKPLVKPGEGKK